MSYDSGYPSMFDGFNSINDPVRKKAVHRSAHETAEAVARLANITYDRAKTFVEYHPEMLASAIKERKMLRAHVEITGLDLDSADAEYEEFNGEEDAVGYYGIQFPINLSEQDVQELEYVLEDIIEAMQPNKISMVEHYFHLTQARAAELEELGYDCGFEDEELEVFINEFRNYEFIAFANVSELVMKYVQTYMQLYPAEVRLDKERQAYEQLITNAREQMLDTSANITPEMRGAAHQIFGAAIFLRAARFDGF